MSGSVCVPVCCPLAYLNKSSAVAKMGDRGYNRHGPKRGGCYAPFAEAGTPSNTMWPGPRPTSMPSAILIHPPFCHNRHGPKNGGSTPFMERGLGPHLSRSVYLDAYIN